MDKKPNHFLVALFLFPTLYTIAEWIHYGSLISIWTTWFIRTTLMGFVVLALLWVLPVKPLVRAAIYVPLMVLAGFTVHLWNNRKGVTNPEFGWSGLVGLYASVLPILLGAAAIVAATVWALHVASARHAGLGSRS